MRHGDWMQTFTGRRFWPLDPRPDEIVVEDIAHALAMQCRYAGHCLRFYSVAEHSVHLARALRAAGADRHAQRWGLLHDAPETYLIDLIRPVKRHMPEYRQVEQRIQTAVAVRFGLTPDIPALVHEFDNRIIADERANLSVCEARWGFDAEPLGIPLAFWAPPEAEAAFLAEFAVLFAEVVS